MNRDYWKKIWGLQLPGKILNFIWRASRQVLPTAANLRIKQVNVYAVCTWCHNYIEDDMHLLFQCCFAQEIWSEMGLQQLISHDTADTVMEVLKRVCGSGTRDQYVMIVLFCWSLWTRRNKWVQYLVSNQWH